MSFLQKRKACIASGFDGRLTFEGKPASGARVIRKIHWKKTDGVVEEVKADKDGGFTLTSQWDTYREGTILNFVIEQEIFVDYNGQEQQILGTSKFNDKEHSEFAGKIKNFRCELTDKKPRGVRGKFGFIATTCYWEQAE